MTNAATILAGITPDLAPKTAIDRMTAAFFACFNNKDGKAVDLSVLTRIMLPQSIITKCTADGQEVMNLEAFIAPRAVMLTDGTLTDFEEEELWEQTELFGSIAQRYCMYRKSGSLAGVPFEARGMKTLQFIKTSEGWRISAAAWDDEREGLPIVAR